jgi:hypothetical protein
MKRLVIAAVLTVCLVCESPGVLTLKPVNTGRDGTYRTTTWQYTYTIAARGSRSEARHGVLTFEGVDMEKLLKARKHDRVKTPWGTMQYFGPELPSFGCGGWLLKRTYDQPLLDEGRMLDPPKAGAGKRYWKEPLRVTVTGGDKTIECAVGQAVTIRLPSEVGSRLAWRVANVTGDAVVQKGIMGLEHADTVDGPRNTHFATFKALKPGKATAVFEYRNPKAETPPARIVCVTFAVRTPEDRWKRPHPEKTGPSPSPADTP